MSQTAEQVLLEIAEACERAIHPAAEICLSETHLNSLQQIATKARSVVGQTTTGRCTSFCPFEESLNTGPAATPASLDHEEIDRLRSALQVIETHELRDHEDFDVIQEIASRARTESISRDCGTRPPAGRRTMQEPVSWRWRPRGDVGGWVYDPKPEWREKHKDDEIDFQPLYTAPQNARGGR